MVVLLCVVWLVVELVVFSYFVLLICLYIFFISSLLFSRFFSSSLVVYALFILFYLLLFWCFLNSLFDKFRCLWGPFLVSWGLFWCHLEPPGLSFGRLGASWNALGRLLASSWALKAPKSARGQ